MCGIAGFWGPRDADLLRRMTGILRHRGPDDDGFFESPSVSLGMRRLSIIDLEGGAQPQANEDGKVQVVHNGEIYNFRELRAELEAAGHRFVTRSDTEVVVHGYEEWGPDCFAHFNGMWADAIVDLRGPTPTLVLGRDHFGIKPLYWARSGDRILFASEIKALLEDPSFHTRPNDQVVYEYLAHGLHDHGSDTFFEGVHELPAAAYAVAETGQLETRRYWRPRLSADGPADPAEFRRLFEKSIERRLVADVPVGTCLSGGLDSSSIVCIMSRQLKEHVPDSVSLGERLKTFSAVFDNDPIDESSYIETVLRATGAERNLVKPTSEGFVDELLTFVWHLDQPVVSTGPYAQWCVMRLARQKVKVLLDGQAGDELLAGYTPYQLVYLRQLLKERRFGELSAEAWAARDILRSVLRGRTPASRRRVQPRRYLRRDFMARAKEPKDERSRSDLKLRLLQDLTTYSLPSLLRYEDRNSMAHSVEARLPYLDQELVEWILRLPESAIVKGGWSRAVLREAMRGVLPEKIRRRRWKVGFTTPEMRWLMRERPVFQSLFRSPAFCSRPYWDGLAIADAFKAACEGELEESLFFWRVINVELWLRAYFGADAARRERDGLGRAGDLEAAVGLSAEAAGLVHDTQPNPGRHLLAVARGDEVYARIPLRSELITSGANLSENVRSAFNGRGPQAGDVIAMSEKAVAIAQGRSLPVDAIRPSRTARILSRFVRRTPVGIGIRMPETMQLALDEVGAPRILAAATLAAAGRPLGLRGVFYRIAGPRVASIDGPTAYTIPPYNTHAKRSPADPERVAAELASALSDGGPPVHVAIVDVNDLGVSILGASPGTDRGMLAEVLRDNPLGQQREQTPFALVRRVS